MKLLGSIIIFTFSFLFSRAQVNPSFQWVKGVWNNLDSHEAEAITTDAQGNSYTTGYFNGIVDFDPGPATYTVNGGGRGIFILKLNANGNFVWIKTLNGNGGEGYSIKLDPLGNIFVTGDFSGTLDFDPGPAINNITATATMQDIFILKLDPLGNYLWVKTISGEYLDWGWSLAVDNLGNSYTTGVFSDTVDFDPGIGVYNLISYGYNDGYVLKLDANGNFNWVKRFGGAGQDKSYDIKMDKQNRIYLTGEFGWTCDFDPGPGVFNLTAAGTFDGFVLKLDANGSFIAAKAFGGTTADVSPRKLALDPLGNIYTGGWFIGTADFDPGIGTYTSTSVGSLDVFIMKLDTLLNFSWAKCIGNTSMERCWALAVDTLGNVYTSGYYSNTVDFDPGAGVYNLSAPNWENCFILKLNTLGNFVWVQNLGGSGFNSGNDILITKNSDIFTVGRFAYTIDFDPGPATFTLSSPSNSENHIFIHKMSQCAAVTISVTSQNVNCFGNSNGSASLAATGGPFTYSWSPVTSSLTSVSNLTAGMYNCLLVNDCGGSVNKLVNITQPSSISITVTASNSLICAGDASTLTALASGGFGPLNYNWFSGPSNSVYLVNPVISNIYTVTITDSNSCTKSQTVSVTTNSLPLISAASNMSLICVQENAILTASGASTYTWTGLGQGATQTISPIITTNYTVTGVDINGCKNSFVITQSVATCAEIRSIIPNFNNFNVFPNPTSGVLNFVSEINIYENTFVKIINAQGQTIEKEKLIGEKGILDISYLPDGMYFILLKQNNTEKMFKVIKE